MITTGDLDQTFIAEVKDIHSILLVHSDALTLSALSQQCSSQESFVSHTRTTTATTANGSTAASSTKVDIHTIRRIQLCR